ncbi:MAG: tripartite tricarboxylate transporter substrate binding protein [Betaproteobacteria bacterium]
MRLGANNLFIRYLFNRSLKRSLSIGLLSAILGLFFSVAHAQNINNETWPTRPIKLIIPFSAGGSLDVFARKIGQKLSEELNTPVIVDNRAGANGMIGTDVVAKAVPDGYTMLIATGSFTGNRALYKKLPYDPIKDLAPITLLGRSYGLILVTKKELPVSNLKDLIYLAKTKPNAVSYGSAGQGNITHLAGELLNHSADLQMLHIPYKGSGPALNEVMAGQIDTTFVSTVGSVQIIKSGRVNPLAITGPMRSPLFPKVPTFSEQGYKPMEDIFGWYGLWFTAGTPPERIEKVQKAVNKLLQLPEVRTQFDELGLMPVGSTSEEFKKFIAEDMLLQAKLFKISNIEPQ